MRDRVRRSAVVLIVAAIVILIDQGTKTLALNTLRQDARIPLIGDWLGLQLAFNPGAIFSLGEGSTWVITVVGLAVTAALIGAATRARNVWSAVGFGFIVGGAIGNLIDRLFSPPAFGIGHVTDFLAYGNLFIGNLADVALGIGAVFLIVAGLRISRRRPDPSSRPDPVAPVPAEETVHP
ncbi:signal peptidase [Microbacterium sp. MEJ108Y]|uniref:signal peptidase II n=1 Tax=Microbacterium sp. MEJ108Y TaxID=1587523 RepID=UPI0005B7427E|nr:signal peptidase II [Microbacterium sp. MEJ108Y]KIP93769.1 signal peptidase [Microbacterium sp. MEJ108Y]